MGERHLRYLQRIVGLAGTFKVSGQVMEYVARVRSANTPIYQMMRDIVCDARFYSVIQGGPFWIDYSCATIRKFIDSLTPQDWKNEEMRTGKKEDFLNDWLAKHLSPLTVEEQRKIEQQLKSESKSEASEGKEDSPAGQEDYLITDKTDSATEIGDSLPPELTDYMQDSERSNTPGVPSDGHEAEARFLRNIDPVLRKLARKIGRKGDVPCDVRSKFPSATRSDISGVTLGNDLNSLLPAELALLASPVSEKVFLQRYAQKRLQMFSSASQSQNRAQSSGPVYICVDTSSSMSGEPEVVAKTLALAITIIAQQERRPVFMVNYSYSLSFFVVTNLEKQRRRFMAFLSNSYDGGNDENLLFGFLFDKLPSTKRGRVLADRLFKGADLLVVSDFIWSDLTERTHALLQKARQEGMKFYALSIMSSLREFYADVLDGGDDFFLGCDGRYVYDNGHCFEYKPSEMP